MTSVPTLDTLIPDIHRLFSPETQVNLDPEVIEMFGMSVKEALVKALTEPDTSTLPPAAPRLRMSRMGRPLRQLWFEQHAHEFDTNTMGEFAKHEIRSHFSGLDSQTKLKMLYGHIIEAMLIALIKLAGHSITNEQKKVVLEGIEGSLDCYVDGTLTDIKSASNYAFKKFKEGTLFDNDPFGYQGQISGYTQAEGQTEAAFIAMNKETAEITIMKVPPDKILDMPERIAKVKEVVTASEPPKEKCYEDVPFSKTSPNRVLNRNCGWCNFKHLCWKDANGGKGLRVFNYANGPTYFTDVQDTPRVEEITEATHSVNVDAED